MGDEELDREDKFAAEALGIGEENAKGIKRKMREKGIVHVVCSRCGYSFWGEIGKSYNCLLCGAEVKV